MAFVKKTWKDRIVQYANRRLLTKSGGEVEQVTVTRDEGTISEAGDQFNASTMNDLENRIYNADTNMKAYVDSKYVVTVGTSGQYASFSALGAALSNGQAVFCFYVNPTDLPSGWLNYGIGIAGKWASIGTRLLVVGIKSDGTANLQTFV